MKMKKFWNWIRDEDGARTLRLDGPIDEDDFGLMINCAVLPLLVTQMDDEELVDLGLLVLLVEEHSHAAKLPAGLFAFLRRHLAVALDVSY